MKEGANILLSLMQLNIGGAETHVVELAKELKRKGYNVIVTSNGGVYVKELEDAGIKHYRAPLQNKKPLNMLRAAMLLKRIIRNEKIDIVHSHARIPSFILGKLRKFMRFPFVTTAHWVFNVGYGLKYITDWGEKTVAVSEDIKTYLMDNYNIPEGDINVTINGIDTDKFSPDTDCSDIKAELDIKDGDNVITYVSRLDESRSLAAKRLIEAIPVIDGQIEKLKVIIIGAGDDFNNVKTMAERVNEGLGREVIVLTGARTDINKLIAPCRLFIGVSRAALEAMSAQKPVIIAGNEGYIGLFDESKLSVGIGTNFCCRGCEMPTAELIARDILKFFSMTAEKQRALGVYGRELIKSDYSVSRMAEDSIRVYDWALKKNREILISGYYGFRNSGDDALLKAIISDLKRYKESPNIVVLSANPQETMKYYRVKAISRLNIPRILSHMNKAEMLISGGGTLMQDRTSTKSLWYYLMIIRFALAKKLCVMLYSNGIGPLERKRNAAITRKTLDRVDLITLRDYGALEALRGIGVTNKNVAVTADPALGLDIADETKGRAILRDEGVPKGVKLLGVSVRRWQGVDAGFETELARACDYAFERYGYYTVFLPMQPNRDLPVMQSIKRKMKNGSLIVKRGYNVEDMLSVMKCFDLCIGMRLHTLIYAAVNIVPLIGIVYDPKISSFMEYTGQRYCLTVENMTYEALKKLLDECISEYDNIKNALRENYGALKEKARLNGKYAIELYERGSADIE